MPPSSVAEVTIAAAVDGAAFADPAVYDLELERVFTRVWQVLGPASVLQRTGDFLTAHIGEDPVVVVRQDDGSLHGLLNSCRHRGMPVCTGSSGNTVALVCPYHLWRYDLAGTFEGVNGNPRTEWMASTAFDLVPLTQVAVVGGVVVGTWDASAPPCDLGWLLPPASAVAVGRSVGGTVRANWKVVAEQARSIPPVLVERVLGGWWLRTVTPRGPEVTEIVGWLLADGTDVTPVATDDVTAGLDVGDGVVAVSMRSPGALADGCPHDDSGPSAPPRPITAATALLYEHWSALLADDRPVPGLPTACQVSTRVAPTAGAQIAGSATRLVS